MKHKILSIVTSVLVVLSGVSPLVANAATASNGSSAADNSSSSNPLDFPKLSSTKQELIAYRTPSSQTFLNPNGTLTTEMHSQPEFYQTRDKKWHNIDDSLVKSSDPNFAYQNGANDFTVSLAGQLRKSNMIQFTKDGDTIDFGLPNGNSNITASVHGNSAQFANVFNSTDLSYSMTPTGVKESLVLQSNAAPSSYSFTLNTQGLTTQQNSDGSIEFLDANSKKPVAWIPAPYMFDANGVTSTDVKQSIASNADGSTTLTVTADPTWLTSSSRQYPVTIDPTITTTPFTPDSSTSRDTFVSSTQSTSNYSSLPSIDAGSSSYYGMIYSLVDFQNPPSLMPGATGATIQSATLSLYQYNANEGGVSVNVEPVTSSWTSGTVDWADQPNIGSVMDTQSQAASPASTSNPYVGTWNFNVTSAVKDWYGAKSSEYGFELQGGTTEYAQFASGDNTQYQGPTLSITYSVQPLGNESFWTNTSDGVNVADGNLMVSQDDLTTPGLGIPVDVARTYNSLNALTPPPGHTNLFGNGWSSPLDMSIADWGHSPIIFTDAEGLQHIFTSSNDYGTTSGSTQKLWQGSPADSVSLSTDGSGNYFITELDGTKYKFNSSRKLVSVTDPSGNATTFSYDSSGMLSGITDASGRNWTVTGDGQGHIKTITDPAGRVATYSYDSAGNLTGVSIVPQAGSSDATTTSYYTPSGSTLMQTVTDPNGNTTTFSYNSTNQVKSVSQPMTVNGSVVQAADSYAYGTDSNGNPTTTVTDANGHSTLYTLNKQGNVTQSQADSTGLNLTTQYTWDQYDQLSTVVDSDSHRTIYTYDNSDDTGISGTGQPIQVQDGNGNYQFAAYNLSGQLTGASSGSGTVTTAKYQSSPSSSGSKVLPSTIGTPLSGVSMTKFTSTGLPSAQSGTVNLGQNLVPNGNFELLSGSLPTGWQDAGGTGTVSDTTSYAEYGSHSIQIQAGTSSPTYLYSTYIPVHPNETYNLSAWVKTSNVTGTLVGNGNVGAALNAHWYTNSTGTFATGTTYGTPTANLDNMTGTNWWAHESDQITAPPDANYLRIDTVLNGTTGTAWWDGIQLEPINDLGTANSVRNGTFADNLPGDPLPVGWYNDYAQNKLDPNTLNAGYPSVELAGTTSQTDNYVYQRISTPQYPWNGIMISAWSKQTNATAPSGSTTYELKVEGRYNDGTVPVDETIPFSASTSGWQYGMRDIPISDFRDSLGNLPSYFYVYCDYAEQTGEAWFNNVQMQFLASSTSVGDFNLISNPGFEYSSGQTASNWPDYWNTATGPGSAAWVNQASSGIDPHTGQYSTKLVPATSGGSEVITSQSQAPANSAGYTLTGYVRTANLAGDDAYLRLDVISSTGTVTSYPSMMVGSSQADVNKHVPWTWLDVYVPSSDLPTGSSVRAAIVVDSDANGSNASAYFDDLALFPYNLFASSTYTNGSLGSYTDQSGYTTQYDYAGSANPSYGSNFTGLNTGDPISITDAVGNKDTYSYNKFDQILSTTYPISSGTATMNYGYDQNGSLTSITDPNGHQVLYQYNQLDEPTSSTETVNGVSKKTTMSYNAGGLLTNITNPNGTAQGFSYDGANRLTSTSYGNGDYFVFGYDKAGNLTSAAENGGASYTFGYDGDNQITSASQPSPSTGSNSESLTLNPDEQPTGIAYNVGGTTWNQSYGYNAGGVLTQSGDRIGTVNYQYTPGNGLSESTNANSGDRTFYTYKPTGQLSEIRTVNPVTNTTLQDYVYVYDGNGNVKQVTNELTGQSLSYTYDGLNELTKETTWSGDTLTYTYDALGNRTSVTDSATGKTTTYTYDSEGNRLASVGGNAVSYDSNGQMLSGNGETYTWNAENQLVSAVNGSTTDTYTYDPLGRRSSFNGYHVFYVGDTDQVAYVTNSNNAITQKYTYNAAGLPVLLSISVNGAWQEYGYVYDGIGEIVGLVDETPGSTTLGQEVVTYQYDAWGNGQITKDTSTSVGAMNPFRYKGYWYDSDTKLYYLNARYYSPALGQFLSEDPVGASAGDVLSHNEYAYATNDPINVIDPTGKQSVLGSIENYLQKTGGRLGSLETRLQLHEIASRLEQQGWKVVNGAGRMAEEFLKGIGPGVRGGNFVDLKAQKGSRTIRINTYTKDSKGNPIQRELNAQSAINSKLAERGEGEIIMIPKGSGFIAEIPGVSTAPEDDGFGMP